MDALKKPETLITVVIAIILVSYIAYDFRKHSASSDRIKQLEDNLASTVRAVDTLSQQAAKMNHLAQELIKLKERQEDLEDDSSEKMTELVQSLEDLVDQLKKGGVNVDVDFPEAEEKKSKKGKKSKRGKKEVKKPKRGKKAKKEESESESESDDDSSDDEDSKSSEALDRMSRIRDKRRDKK